MLTQAELKEPTFSVVDDALREGRGQPDPMLRHEPSVATKTRHPQRKRGLLMVLVLLALAIGTIFALVKDPFSTESEPPTTINSSKVEPAAVPKVPVADNSLVRVSEMAETSGVAPRPPLLASTQMERDGAAEVGQRMLGTPHSVSAVPLVSSSADAPAETAGNLATVGGLHERVNLLSEQVSALTGELKSLADTDSQTSKKVVRLEQKVRSELARIARAAMKIRPVRIAAESTSLLGDQAAIQAEQRVITSTRLLAVDTWNGVPNVSISQGQEVRFLSEGDATPEGLVLRKADPGTQRAVFQLPSGKLMTAPVTAGAGE
jgi:hypothetical protein